MLQRIKKVIKKALALVGLYHPSLGIKISSEAKGSIILEHKTPDLKIFVETGTYNGDMLERVGKHFEKMYSVELDEDLYAKAKERFKGRNEIFLLQGDSAVKINTVLMEIHEPALFWLDAHESGPITMKGPNPAPIEKELESIMAHPIRTHVILIDDARQFDRSSIERIKALAKTNGYRYELRDGLFRLYGSSR